MNIRRLMGLLLCVLAASIFFLMSGTETTPGSRDLMEYYIENSVSGTGSGNYITAIYLNYRFFDTLFETLTLLVSVIGIIYFSRHNLGGGKD